MAEQTKVIAGVPQDPVEGVTFAQDPVEDVTFAPDAAPGEVVGVGGRKQTVQEVLAGGPQPIQSSAEKAKVLADLAAEVSRDHASADGRVQRLNEAVDRAKEKKDAPPALPDGLEPMGEMEALSALELMLSTEMPRPETKALEIPRLTRQRGSKFVITVRGLADGEMDGINEKALREPTEAEKKAGITWPVRDESLQRRLILERALIEPNLQDPRLLQKFGPTSIHVIQRWFNSGEIEALSTEVAALSGYADNSVTQAKGS